MASILAGCEAQPGLWQRLQTEILPNSQPPVSPTAAESPAIAKMETEVREQINQIRQEKGLQPLKHNQRLAEVARKYSQQMASKNFFSHTSPAGDDVAQRVRAANIYYWVVGENLFKSVNVFDPVPAGVKGWMESPGHRENILRPEYTETGVGIWRTGNTYYFTQLFLRPL
jgi:uncharacterized protein YkwD